MKPRRKTSDELDEHDDEEFDEIDEDDEEAGDSFCVDDELISEWQQNSYLDIVIDSDQIDMKNRTHPVKKYRQRIEVARSFTEV